MRTRAQNRKCIECSLISSMNRFVNRLKTDFTKIIERLPFELQRQILKGTNRADQSDLGLPMSLHDL